MVWNVIKKLVAQAKLIDKKNLELFIDDLVIFSELDPRLISSDNKTKNAANRGNFLSLINGESFDQRSHILLLGGISETLN